MHGSLVLLLNERGCDWWLTWLVGLVLFWSDRKGGFEIALHLSPRSFHFVRRTKSIKAFISILHKDFFQCYQMWLFSKCNLVTIQYVDTLFRKAQTISKIWQLVISYRHPWIQGTQQLMGGQYSVSVRWIFMLLSTTEVLFLFHVL